jgi:hypothetical protein
MSIQTRKPTGKPPWPIVLLAGGEKAGKSYAAAEASASDLIDRTFWIGIGEDDPDEYGSIPGARFEIVPHNGTHVQILAKLEEAVKEPAADGKENLIVIDSGTRLWDMLSDEANARAVSRARAKAEKYNRAFSTDAEVTIGPDLWNRATGRWNDVMDLLRLHAGPSIITARLETVAVMDDKGSPTKDKIQKVKAQKSLPFDVGVVIEMPSRGEAYIGGVRSLKIDIPVGQKQPYKNFTMDSLWRNLGITEPGATSPRQHSGADGQASAAVPDEQPQAPAQQQRPQADPNEDAGSAALHARQAAARTQAPPAPSKVDWSALYLATGGDRGKLEALRHSAKSAGAPDNFWLFAKIESALTESPLEGKVA